MVPVETLKKLDIFDGLSEDELNAVKWIAEVEDYPKGSKIFKENEEARKLYILQEGRVAIQFEVGRHLEEVVHTVSSGQAFGWSALVVPYQFTASARCMAESKVITIDREGIRRLFEEDCHIGFIIMEKLAELISERLRETRLQLLNLVHG